MAVLLPSAAMASSAFPLEGPALLVAIASGVVWGMIGPLLQLRRSIRKWRFYSVAALYCIVFVGTLGYFVALFAAHSFGVDYYDADRPGKVLVIFVVSCILVAVTSIAGLSPVRKWVDDKTP